MLSARNQLKFRLISTQRNIRTCKPENSDEASCYPFSLPTRPISSRSDRNSRNSRIYRSNRGNLNNRNSRSNQNSRRYWSNRNSRGYRSYRNLSELSESAGSVRYSEVDSSKNGQKRYSKAFSEISEPHGQKKLTSSNVFQSSCCSLQISSCQHHSVSFPNAKQVNLYFKRKLLLRR